jgi:hypothetical protein
LIQNYYEVMLFNWLGVMLWEYEEIIPWVEWWVEHLWTSLAQDKE